MENHNSFTCPICGNTDIHSIGMLNGKHYCRRCISFRGEEVEHKPSYPKKAPIHLEYELSPEQKELSEKLVENYKKGIDSLVFAVCGSGKTEIVISTIKFVLESGGKVGFAIPRRDVVVELALRFQKIFSKNIITTVFGGNTSLLEGDIVCMTTHQLFRYNSYFDLLILDEIDAFPYEGNETLHQIMKRATKGFLILMTATPSKKIINEFSRKDKSILKLYKRYHGDIIPVPKILKLPSLIGLIYLLLKLKRFIKNEMPVFIFVPTIYECKSIYNLLKFAAKPGYFINSQSENRKEIIEKFRNGEYKYLVTTAVLERGVTLKNLQVIVYHSDSSLYKKSTLIQIAGRVGRVIGATKGEVIFIGKKRTKQMEEAIEEIRYANNVV